MRAHLSLRIEFDPDGDDSSGMAAGASVLVDEIFDASSLFSVIEALEEAIETCEQSEV